MYTKFLRAFKTLSVKGLLKAPGLCEAPLYGDFMRHTAISVGKRPNVCVKPPLFLGFTKLLKSHSGFVKYLTISIVKQNRNVCMCVRSILRSLLPTLSCLREISGTNMCQLTIAPNIKVTWLRNT